MTEPEKLPDPHGFKVSVGPQSGAAYGAPPVSPALAATTQQLIDELVRRSKAHAIALVLPTGPNAEGVQSYYTYGQTIVPEATRGIAATLLDQVEAAVRGSITKATQPAGPAIPTVIDLKPLGLPGKQS